MAFDNSRKPEDANAVPAASDNAPQSVGASTPISRMSLTPRHCYIVLVASMEQLIGASVSTIAGIIIPLLNMLLHPELTAAVQGVVGATGLTGIAVGSAVIGPLSDRQGYSAWFRICPLLIIAGSLVASVAPHAATICAGLFVAGLGVGGGYALDSDYISELMPDRWKSFMVGVAKATCALGFIIPAALTVFILHLYPEPNAWRYIVWIMTALGVVTFLMRLRWPGTPVWYSTHRQYQKADTAAKFFFGSKARPDSIPPKHDTVNQKNGIVSLLKGRNLLKVIYSGIPWACEGLGVYGIGVFLPVLIMALGIDNNHTSGIPQVINSVELTAVINFCILPGFVIGLLIVNRLNHELMMWTGFIGSAFAMALLLAAYLLHWPLWVSVTAFMIFEILLNAGPHLVTYIIPAEIYPVADRGAGSGIADFLGKLGAIIGVFFMPLLLRAGGMTLVLIVTIGVMLSGGVVTIIAGRLLRKSKDLPSQ